MIIIHQTLLLLLTVQKSGKPAGKLCSSVSHCRKQQFPLFSGHLFGCEMFKPGKTWTVPTHRNITGKFTQHWHTDRIHVRYIYPHVRWFFLVNVGINVPYMDAMGYSCPLSWSHHESKLDHLQRFKSMFQQEIYVAKHGVEGGCLKWHTWFPAHIFQIEVTINLSKDHSIDFRDTMVTQWLVVICVGGLLFYSVMLTSKNPFYKWFLGW